MLIRREVKTFDGIFAIELFSGQIRQQDLQYRQDRGLSRGRLATAPYQAATDFETLLGSLVVHETLGHHWSGM
jgi:hypothetical protein